MPRVCPCGSGCDHDDCCGPLLRGAAAPTAQRLMRSRYSAYVLLDEAHLLRTWHPSSRPPSIDLDPTVVWTALEVLRAERGTASDAFGLVEFRASFERDGEPETLHEVSRFARTDDGWSYVRGRLVE